MQDYVRAGRALDCFSADFVTFGIFNQDRIGCKESAEVFVGGAELCLPSSSVNP